MHVTVHYQMVQLFSKSSNKSHVLLTNPSAASLQEEATDTERSIEIKPCAVILINK